MLRYIFLSCAAGGEVLQFVIKKIELPTSLIEPTDNDLLLHSLMPIFTLWLKQYNYQQT